MSIANSDPSPLELANSSSTQPVAPSAESSWNYSELPLIGRSAEVAQIKQHLLRSSLVTLVGLGGVGKTRVASQVAQELAPSMSGSVYWVDVSNVSTQAEWDKAIAQAMGITLPSSQDAQTTQAYLAAYLHRRQMLLVLDGFEHLIDQVLWLTSLHTAANNPLLRILVTSRERLNIPNEVVAELRGLSTQTPLKSLNANHKLSPAEELFLYHASKAQPSYVMTNEEHIHVRRICTLVNGTPLAIELAAAWIALLPAKFIAEQIQRNLDWLTTSVGLTHSPQKSMRASIEYFWALLSANEKRYLRQLSVFRDGFDRELAQEVTDVSLFFLMALIDRDFLVRQTSGRYALHAMLRQFAEEQLQQNIDEATTIRQRHAETMFKLLNHISEGWLEKNDRSWLHRFDVEHANIRAAIQWAITNKSADLAIKMATQISVFYQQRGNYAAGIQLIESARALLERPTSDDHFKALLAQAELQIIIGEFSAAMVTVQQAIQDLPPDLADYENLYSQIYALLASIETRQGQYLNAQQHIQEGVQAARRSHKPATLARALQCEGHVHRENSNYAQATQACQEALILYQRLQNQAGIASVHFDLGNIYLLQKEFAAAARAFKQTQTLYEQLEDRLRATCAVLALGTTAYEQRDFTSARTNAEKSMAIFKELGIQEYIVQAHLLLGDIAIEQSQNPEADYLLGLDGALRLGLMPCMLAGLCGVARARMHNGRNTSAVELIGLILSHVASNSAVVQEGNSLLTQLRRLLSHKDIERHLASGQRRNLHHTVREILAEGTIG